VCLQDVIPGCTGSKRLEANHARESPVVRKAVPRAAVIPLAALILSGCVSQSAYNEQAAQLQQVQAQVAVQQAEIAKMQAENKWVVAGDLIFPGAANSSARTAKRRSTSMSLS
jgi:hypothetical protein